MDSTNQRMAFQLLPTSSLSRIRISTNSSRVSSEHVVAVRAKYPRARFVQLGNRSRCRVCMSSQTQTIKVALTREDGKNDNLRNELNKMLELSSIRNIEMVDLPCIQHGVGPDYPTLQEWAQDLKKTKLKEFDWIIITSPEAAHVFHSAFGSHSHEKAPLEGLPVKVAAVGKATSVALREAGIPVDFVPSIALGENLAEELPWRRKDDEDYNNKTHFNDFNRVLYPASVLAKDTVQSGLESRNFSVTRLNVYDTVPATMTASNIELAKSVDIATFASPSAVKSWVFNVGQLPKKAICIGKSSAVQCKSMGMPDDAVVYPAAPGLEGWAECIMRSIAELQKTEAKR